VSNIVQEFLGQVFDRTEYFAGNDIGLDLGRPDLDLVQPGRIGWRKVDTHLAMAIDELPNLRGAMGCVATL